MGSKVSSSQRRNLTEAEKFKLVLAVECDLQAGDKFRMRVLKLYINISQSIEGTTTESCMGTSSLIIKETDSE